MKLYIFLICIFSFGVVLLGNEQACKGPHQVDLNKILQKGYTQNTHVATIENQNQDVKTSSVKKEIIPSYFKTALYAAIGFGAGTFVCLCYIINQQKFLLRRINQLHEAFMKQCEINQKICTINDKQCEFNQQQCDLNGKVAKYIDSRWF